MYYNAEVGINLRIWIRNSSLVCKILHKYAKCKHYIANFADFHADFYADFAYFYADFCIGIPPHYNVNAEFLLCQPPHMHYNAEFRIIPYKWVAWGIINEFTQGG